MRPQVIFLDCEFTDFTEPHLLSVGLVELRSREGGQPRELYAELDLVCDDGLARTRVMSDFVRQGPVLGQWGLVPGATCSHREMGMRAAAWLQAAACGGRLAIAFDYATDMELLEYALRHAGKWTAMHNLVVPLNVALETDTRYGDLAKDAAYADLEATRGLRRHHALADAYALRAAWLASLRTTEDAPSAKA